MFSTQKSRPITFLGPKKSADEFSPLDAGRIFGLTGPKIELVSVDQWSVTSRQQKTPIVTIVQSEASAESGLAPYDIQQGLDSHSPV